MNEAKLYKSFEDAGIILTSNADNQYTECPFCQADRKPQNKHKRPLKVIVSKHYFKCHHCGAFGYTNYNGEVEDYKTAMPMTENGYIYFERRGISRETVDNLKITMGKNIYMIENEQYENVIAFNYYDNYDRIVDIKYRAKNKAFQRKSKPKDIFYNYQNWYNADTVIITEGEMDTASFVEAGIKEVGGVPFGGISEKTKKPEDVRMEYITNCQEGLDNKKRIYLALDNDITGTKMRDELERRLGAYRCYRVTYPENCKDANEVLVNYGKEVLLDIIENAEPSPVSGIYTVKDVMLEYDNIYNYGYEKGYSTQHWKNFDKHFQFFRSCLIVGTGVPSHGKTTFMDNALVLTAKNSGMRWGMFTPESGGTANHSIRQSTQYVGKPFVAGNYLKASLEEKEQAVEFLSKYFFDIKPPSYEYTLKNIIDIAKKEIYRNGIDGLLIDPFSSLDYLDPNIHNRDIVKNILNELGEFAYSSKICVCIIAHPKKMEMIKRNGLLQPEVPTPYSISESAQWYNIPDICFSVYRSKALNEQEQVIDDYTAFNIQKMRYDWQGKEGSVKFNFDIVSKRYTEIESGSGNKKLQVRYEDNGVPIYDEDYERDSMSNW